ncbi:hypothetical protein M758_1G330800 [Ceratodon purpureus]|uniref:Uncharacterized protein n=1 Tax=Ceratodon purpureus TaxID=3225 RepID=A0A8T0JEZ6_CERPU|nr:hypothetical protein KC19_1G338300 [Ceratodon purpureus]KAG0632470.1 hypothetical protein M758_1G330800 [Ceratodon purpureus]
MSHNFVICRNFQWLSDISWFCMQLPRCYDLIYNRTR